MTLGTQILWGSLFLCACLILHAGILAVCVRVIEATNLRNRHKSMWLQIMIVLFLALAGIIFAITAEVWIWSAAWIGFDVLPDWNSSVYFSLVTFTALGYGDLVLGPELRIFGAFAAVTGLLSFGLSTAFLVAVTHRLFQDDMEP